MRPLPRSHGSHHPRVLALALLAFVVGTPTRAHAQAARIIPTQMCGDYFFVPIELGGDPDRTLWMILDTGANETIVDPESVERVSDANISAGQRVNLTNATAGPLTYSRLPTRARDLDHLSLTLGREIDGILGYNAFEDVLLTLDYPDREVRVGSGRLDRPNDATIFDTVRRTNRPFFPLRVGDRETLVLIDSGSRGGLTLDADVDWGWEHEPRLVGAAARINRIELRWAGRAEDNAVFGRALIETPIIDLTEGTQLIGTQIMRHFELTFDQRSQRVRIVRSGDGPLSLPERRGLGLVLRPVGEAFEIARVFGAGPGDKAGLEEGDVITHFDGLPVLNRGCEPRLGSRGDETAMLRVTVRRGDDTFEADVEMGVLLQ